MYDLLQFKFCLIVQGFLNVLQPQLFLLLSEFDIPYHASAFTGDDNPLHSDILHCIVEWGIVTHD